MTDQSSKALNESIVKSSIVPTTYSVTKQSLIPNKTAIETPVATADVSSQAK